MRRKAALFSWADIECPPFRPAFSKSKPPLSTRSMMPLPEARRATSENSVMAKFSIAPAQTAQEGSSNPHPTPGGPSSSNETPGLLPLVDHVDASVGALEVAIGVVPLLDASDLAQKLASGRRQFL